MSEPKQKKTIKQIISNVTFGVFMAFFGLVILFSILEKTVGFSIGGYHILWVKTDSMETTIPAQSYILTKDIKAEDVNVNDVISFISDDPAIKGMLNTHRVIEITDEGSFITKGDNYAVQDAYKVKPENVVARYEKNLPFLSIFGKLFTTPIGYGLTVVGIVGLVAMWFTIDFKERKKESKEELINKMIKKEVERLENESKNKNEKK